MSQALAICILVADPTLNMDAGGFVTAAREAVAFDPAGEMQVVIVGRETSVDIERSAFRAGAASVVSLSHAMLAAPPVVDQLLSLLGPQLSAMMAEDRPAAVIFHADSVGEELAARLATRLGGAALGVCSTLTAATAGWNARKAIMGARVEVTLSVQNPRCFAAIRSAHDESATAPAAGDSVTAQARRTTATSELPDVGSISYRMLGHQQRRVESAGIVVTGGRGMAGPEGFVQLQRLASALDGALGGSLPAVDAGWVPVSHQVGQSGRYVAPRAYVAVGLSGTPQHMAGVAPGTEIVAINSDANADIFKYAKVGAVADWKQLLPALIDKLAAMRSDEEHAQ